MNNLYEVCYSSMGVYPQKFGDKKRTEWQEGWNAFGSAFINRVCALADWINNHPQKELVQELLELDVMVSFEPISLSYNCGDIFAWGYADCEKITEDMMLDVYNALKEEWGIIKYHCRKHNEKPQWPIEVDMRKSGVWDLEDLPECRYDLEYRWKTKTRQEAIIENLSQN